MMGERTQPANVSSAAANEWAGTVHHFDEIGSTMVEARRLAEAGSPHGTVVEATRQEAGRGRSGGVWVSPPGNLHTTIILRPGSDARHAPQLGFVVALAVAAAIDRLAGPFTALKWPNDVMRDGAKLAGILLERTDQGAVLAGVGVNVRHAPPDMPYPVTSLRALGCDVDPAVILAAILDALQGEWENWRTQGFASVLQRWRVRGPEVGARLVARLGPERVAGRFAGLRADGALLLDTQSGQRAIVAGDIQPCARSPT